MLYIDLVDRQGIDDQRLGAALQLGLQRLGRRRRVLLLPPDITRLHSRAGDLTRHIWEHWGESVAAIMPTLGTHRPMTAQEIDTMFAGVPAGLFRTHDWRGDVVELGRAPASLIERLSEGRLHFPWPVQLNRLLVEGDFDLILSIGQVVPHEVAGMANYTKNVLIGAGGRDGIATSHWLGAVYGMERIMGRAETPVRQLLDWGAHTCAGELPLVYLLTVLVPDAQGQPRLCGLFMGDDRTCYERAAALSAQVNVTVVPQPLTRALVWLDPREYRSMWLGNKAIYRLRMAMAEGGELIILAPAVDRCGEDEHGDALIRRFGYGGRERVMALVEHHPELQRELGVAAHLIHGSSEGRFDITYCPGGLSASQTERLGYRYDEADAVRRRYRLHDLRPGYNRMTEGEPLFFVPNPATGLWVAPGW